MILDDKTEKIVSKSFLVWNIQDSKEHVSQDRLMRFRTAKNEMQGDRVHSKKIHGKMNHCNCVII